jgi:hypothetical protein
VPTTKQVDALIRIIAVIRKSNHEFPLTPPEVAKVRADIELLSPAEVRDKFAELNKLTGFDRHRTDATDEQRRLIARLERRVFGAPRTTYRTALNYAAASDLIAALIARRNVLDAAKDGDK